MSDKERCKNCLEPLCDGHGNGFLPDMRRQCDGWEAHHIEHHDTAIYANEHCTRAQVVLVKGCNECGLSRTRYCCPPIYHYGWTPGQSSVPEWCPITKGLTLRAVLPAEEKEG